jgi:hypothetical protein
MSIKHATQTGEPNDASKDVSADAWNEGHDVEASGFAFGSGGPTISSGAGDPEGSVTAPAGSIYLRTTGVVYSKASGSGNTGWVSVVTFGG